MSANYFTLLKKQNTFFLTQGPKAPAIWDGKHHVPLINTLNLLLGTVTLQCVGVHVGCLYDLAPGDFNWEDQDGLMNVMNPGAAASGGIFVTASGSPGTLIQRQLINTPPFTTAFLPQS